MQLKRITVALLTVASLAACGSDKATGAANWTLAQREQLANKFATLGDSLDSAGNPAGANALYFAATAIVAGSPISSVSVTSSVAASVASGASLQTAGTPQLSAGASYNAVGMYITDQSDTSTHLTAVVAWRDTTDFIVAVGNGLGAQDIAAGDGEAILFTMPDQLWLATTGEVNVSSYHDGASCQNYAASAGSCNVATFNAALAITGSAADASYASNTATGSRTFSFSDDALSGVHLVASGTAATRLRAAVSR